ncbi:MAG: ATP-binding protein [Verrucomicrobia bacterium]|nr:ATP-binding protein [Verrucomicrobiota bacterium]
MTFSRAIAPELGAAFAKPFVHVLFGARQTGKSTLLRQLVPTPALALDFSDPSQRSAYLGDPGRLVRECRALPSGRPPPAVVIDEAQAVPAIFDAIQHLHDSDKHRWRFILCGSSARKLRQTGANLLPGRALLHRLTSLTLGERPAPGSAVAVAPELAFPLPPAPAAAPRFPAVALEERLATGELPGVATLAAGDRGAVLRSYVHIYLQEELRREALVKDWAAFVRFLELAARESGQLVDYARISRGAGISAPTVKSHYQLLEDLFVGFSLPAFSGSPRKSLLSTPRFVLFDTGLRHAAAGLEPSTTTVAANPGPVFEQWVLAELWKRTVYQPGASLSYLRTKAGAEIDCILTHQGKHHPIEIKWTDHPTVADARHLAVFLAEHKPAAAPLGFVICRCQRPELLAPRIVALPWSAF